MRMKMKTGGTVSNLLKDVPIPKMFHARQAFEGDHIAPEQIPEIVKKRLDDSAISGKIRPGMQIAITMGSRGIRNSDIIVKSIVDYVKSKGAFPFIVPAMGSHGGATGEGQRAVLAQYHVTEETVGCPVKSSMETVYLGESSLGRPVYMDKNAYEADGTILFCRIKPHNGFRGKYESGCCKMLTVGLGKQKGASIVHGDGMDRIAQNIPDMAKVVLEKANILGAVPCIENAYDETCRIEALPAEDIMEREPELLKYAFTRMPSLLVGETDVLIVDTVGKNISGSGVDPNITGTFSTPYASGGIKVQRTCFLNLTPESEGNALGCGLASAITKKIFDEIDAEKMYPNCITSTVLRSAMIPCVVGTEKEAVQICIRTCNKIDRNHARAVRISDSLHIGEIMLSESYYEDVCAGKYPGVTALDEPKELEFDVEDNIVTPTIDRAEDIR